jgi:hypothetical protein
MLPRLPVYPAGPATDQLTALLKLPLPVTVAANCTVVPMVAEVSVGEMLTLVTPFAT